MSVGRSARVWPAVALASSVLLLSAGCKKSGSDTSTNPSGTSSLSGTWTGTLSRPDGLAPIAVRWEATRTDGPMSGPITLTNGSSSVTFPLSAAVSGPGSSVTSIHFNIGTTAGSIPTLPACSILANDSVDASGLKEPITTITTNVFTMNYGQCQGFVDPVTNTNFRTESTQLTITKP